MQFLEDPNQIVNLRRVLSEQARTTNGDLLCTPSHYPRYYPNLAERIVRCKAGDYQILQEIGHPGAFGCGWKVKRWNVQPIQGKNDVSDPVFLKSYFIPKGYAQDDYEMYVTKVLRELDMVERMATDTSIRHPNIVMYLDSMHQATIQDENGNELPPIACIVTELVDSGTDLVEWWDDWDHACNAHGLRRSGLDIDGVARFFFREMMQGVDHAHRHGAFHYDLKLENIMVSADGRSVKLIDFGLGKKYQQTQLEEWVTREREHSQRCSMPNYTAPEARQLEVGDTTLLGPVDLWCCGNILATLALHGAVREAGVDRMRSLRHVCRIGGSSWEEHMAQTVKRRGAEVAIRDILASRFGRLVQSRPAAPKESRPASGAGCCRRLWETRPQSPTRPARCPHLRRAPEAVPAASPAPASHCKALTPPRGGGMGRASPINNRDKKDEGIEGVLPPLRASV
jgi:serine/threonine protein kinase